jgi:NADP-dependent 3-hydroxy acid dehydrogenase YdfG
MSKAAAVNDKPIAVVTGVGPGTGSAIVRRFAAGGFRVFALARSPDRIRVLERELPDTHAMICDVSRESEVGDAIAGILNRTALPASSSIMRSGEGGEHFLKSTRRCSNVISE